MADSFFDTTNDSTSSFRAVREALAIAKLRLVYRRFLVPEEIKMREGKIAKWIRFSKRGTVLDTDYFAAETLNSTQNEVRAVGDTLVSATLAHHIGKPEGWTAAAEYASFVDLPKGIREIVATQAGETLDGIARDVLAAGTNVSYANGKTIHSLLSSDYLDTADISQVAANLAGRSARAIDVRFAPEASIPDTVNAEPLLICFIHPFEKFYLMAKDTVFQNAVQLQKQSLFTGHLVDWGGVRFIETENAPTLSSTGSNSSITTADRLIFIGNGAAGQTYVGSRDFSLVYTPPGGHSDRAATQHALTWKSWHKELILNEDWLESLVVARASAITA